MLSGAIVVFIFADIPTAAYKKGASILTHPYEPNCFVFPWGVEPQSSEPESDILSIELWELPRLASASD